MTDWLKKALLILILLTLAGCGRHRDAAIPVDSIDAPPRRAISATKPPVAPAEFDVKVWPGGRREITWKDDMAGDYNLDLSIDGKDLFLLAVHFDEESNFNGHSATEEGNDAIDGNRDGELNGLDLFLISSRFNSSISGYRLFTSMTIDGPYDEQFGEDVPLSENYPFGDYLVEQPDNFIAPLYFKVAAIDKSGAPGIKHEYRPKQLVVWGEAYVPYIGYIDGTDRRYLIDPDDFDGTQEEWEELVYAQHVYLSTNGSLIVVEGGPQLLVYEVASKHYQAWDYPENFRVYSRGNIVISGDGTRIFVAGSQEGDSSTFRRIWFNHDLSDSGELDTKLIPGVGNDPDWLFLTEKVYDGEEFLGFEAFKEHMFTKERISAGVFPICTTAWHGSNYTRGLKLSGNGKRIGFVTYDYPSEGDNESFLIVDIESKEVFQVMGPVEDGLLNYPALNSDGTVACVVNEIGLGNIQQYTFDLSGTEVDTTTYQWSINQIKPAYSPDLLIHGFKELGAGGVSLRSPDGDTIGIVEYFDPQAAGELPVSMMGN